MTTYGLPAGSPREFVKEIPSAGGDEAGVVFGFESGGVTT